MAIKFDAMENALMYVSMDQPGMHHAILCKETGQMFYTSEMGDSDELPDDIDEPKYVSIPHQNELDLGRNLVFEFVSEFLSDEKDRVNSFFRGPGAYSRYKELLSDKGLLDKWHDFEDQRQKDALKDWCAENGIELEG